MRVKNMLWRAKGEQLWHWTDCGMSFMFQNRVSEIEYKIRPKVLTTQVEKYLDDVFECTNWQTPRPIPFEEEHYIIRWINMNYEQWMRAYGGVCLIRNLEEDPKAVIEYFRLREFMPRDAALYVSSLYRQAWDDHAFRGTLGTLVSLHKFSIHKLLKDIELQKLPFWDYVDQAEPWNVSYEFCSSLGAFKFTPALYNLFVKGLSNNPQKRTAELETMIQDIYPIVLDE